MESFFSSLKTLGKCGSIALQNFLECSGRGSMARVRAVELGEEVETTVSLAMRAGPGRGPNDQEFRGYTDDEQGQHGCDDEVV
jgi:hypothetical protein